MTTTNANAKRIPAVTTAYDDTTGILTVSFATGEATSITIADLSPDIIQRAIVHGLNAKLVDAAAISRNTETGKSASAEDKRDAVVAVAERLINGEWNAKRAAGEGEATILLAALMRVYPDAGRDKLQSRIDGWSKEERAAIRLHAKVARAIADIQAERAAAKGIDSEDLLANL